MTQVSDKKCKEIIGQNKKGEILYGKKEEIMDTVCYSFLYGHYSFSKKCPCR